MPSRTTLRIVLGALSGGLAVFGFLGVLFGFLGMMGLDPGCTDQASVCAEFDDQGTRTFDQYVEATLVAVCAFLLGTLVVWRLARDS